MEYFPLIIAVIFIVAFLFAVHIKKQRKKANIINEKRSDIKKAVRNFDEYLNKASYFNYRKLSNWKSQNDSLFNSLPKEFESLPLDEDLLAALLKFKNYSLNSTSLRESYNTNFITDELQLNKKLFESIEKYPLTQKQREAIVTDEDNNLIIAGAGTGKTSTLLGKVIYLLRSRKVEPEKILVLAFTRKASEEIRDRIKHITDIEMDIKTFHKFGLDIISTVEDKKPSIAFTDESGNDLKDFINSIHRDLLRQPRYQELISTYFLSYLRPYKPLDSYKNQGEYYKSLKSYQTLKGETCKSHEEIEIANFLYVNNVEYFYEKEYEHKTATKTYSQYKPDFYLPDYKIYIEHFGLIDRNGNVPNWFSAKGGVSAKIAYNESRKWKLDLHKKNSTTLVETFSYEKKEGRLLELLKQRLINKGVQFNSTPIQIITRFEEKNEFPAFVNLIITFLNLTKSNGYGIKDLNKIVTQKKLLREEKFLEVFEPIYKKYQIYLRDNDKIDFSDMLIKAANYISSNQFISDYKYVLIDEFQDISVGRYKLISNLIKQNPEQRLFCVGDDWQSIYRFTGSDLSIMTEFEKYFGYTKRIDLDLTFRLNDKVCDLTQKFILKNPKQLKKNLISKKLIENEPFEIIYDKKAKNGDNDLDFDDNVDTNTALEKCLNSIERIGSNKSVFIIGRYNFQEPEKELLSLKRKYKSFDIKYITAHSSKGLEADYVILLNINAGKYGFPSEIIDDPILNLVLQTQDEIENAEERRLFYVALTRTRNILYIICNQNKSSKFVNEILSDNHLIKKCPECKEGILIERMNSSKNTKFYGCENYPLCSYTKNINVNFITNFNKHSGNKKWDSLVDDNDDLPF